MADSKRTRRSNGLGTIYQDKKTKVFWGEIHWTDKSGVKHKKKFSSKKQTVVKSKLDDFRRQLLISNGDITKTDITFREYADMWLKTIKTNQDKITSVQRIECTLRNQVYPYIGDIPLDQVTYKEVQNMINDITLNKGLSYSTAKKAKEAISGCYRYYRQTNHSTLNPCEMVVLPEQFKKDPCDITFYNEEQIRAIIKSATKTFSNNVPVYRLGWAVVLIMYTGIRIGELVGLRWEDVDFENRIMYINQNAVTVQINGKSQIINQTPKSKKSRRPVPLSESAYQALVELHKVTGNDKYVITTRGGKQKGKSSIDKMFKRILVGAGIITWEELKNSDSPHGVHTLRHTFASMLYRNGCETKTVSELVGHQNTKTTENTYIHLINEQKVKAISDIDKYFNKK